MKKEMGVGKQQLKTAGFAMKRAKLSTEITVIIILKLIILYGIWSVFFAPNQVSVDANTMFERVQSEDMTK